MLRPAVMVTVYVLMGALGLSLLADGRPPDATGTASTLSGALLAGIGAAGVFLVAVLPRLGRRRPAVSTAVAPSGSPATYFRRRADVVVASVLGTLGLAGWLGWVAAVLAMHDRAGWASMPAGLAFVLLWPCIIAAAGKVEPGGLWLSATGIEHRREAETWTVRWEDLDSVHLGPGDGAAGYAARSGLVPVEPVVLVLRPDAHTVVERTARWVWNRGIVAPPGSAFIDAFGLAGGPQPIAELIRGCLARPELRSRLGLDNLADGV